MDIQLLEQNRINILNKLLNSRKILVIASKPIDKDSICTALSIDWFVRKIGNNLIDTDIVVFSNMPFEVSFVPNVDKVKQFYIREIDFNKYDCIILVDGNSWKQFFTIHPERYLSNIEKSKLINIDHHFEGEIEKYIYDSFVRVEDVCTAKVFYDYFISKSNLQLDIEVAEYLFSAVIGDTGNFRHGIKQDTFKFAQMLVDVGINVSKLTYSPIQRISIDIMFWMYKNTIFVDEIKCMIFKLDNKLRQEATIVFGKSWEFDNYDFWYKLYFGGNILNYPYFLKFSEDEISKKRVRISWRRSNWNADVNIMEVLKSCGFVVGGHINAGGGYVENISIDEAIESFITKMKVQEQSRLKQ
ncbi:MAG: DHH family phosphoesterase [Candidatus Dojkabacteria bacterium]|nr:DHH family phosphoesterase [Candidatus Dojkabacteria bacterium]